MRRRPSISTRTVPQGACCEYCEDDRSDDGGTPAAFELSTFAEAGARFYLVLCVDCANELREALANGLFKAGAR